MKVQIKIHSTPTIKMSTGEIVRIIQPVPGVVYKDELRDLVITDGVDKEALDVSWTMAPINVRKGAVISANGVYTGVTINTAGQLEIARLNAENIRKGVDILGAIGTMEGATSVEEYMRLIDYIANMRDLRPINENDYNNKCVERTQALINFYRGED